MNSNQSLAVMTSFVYESGTKRPLAAKPARASQQTTVRNVINSLLDTIGDLRSKVEERDQVIDETQRVLEACSSLHAQCQSVQRAPQPRAWLALTDGIEEDREDNTSDSHSAASDEEQDLDEQDPAAVKDEDVPINH